MRHQQDGPRYVYLPTVARDNAKRSAMRHMLKTFFDGSAEQAISALLDENSSRAVAGGTRSAGAPDRHGAEERSVSHDQSLRCRVLLEAVARATVILASAGLVAAALRRSSASARHLVWVLGLVSALLVPAFSLALPRWEVPIVTIRSAPRPTSSWLPNRASEAKP